jgi:hypothetical protein
MLRAILVVVGIVIAAVGGVVAYRAYFLEPTAAIIITNTDVRELPNTFRIVGGVVLLIVGAAIAYTAALRKKVVTASKTD